MLDNLKKMDVSGFTEMSTDRRHWRRLVLEARVHVGLKKKRRKRKTKRKTKWKKKKKKKK